MKKFAFAVVTSLFAGASIMATLVNAKQAQVTAVVPPNTAFQISFDHPGDVTYRWACDGTILKNFSKAEVTAGKSATANADGTFTFTLSVPGMAKGVHNCNVWATYVETTDEQKSELIPVNVDNAHVAPVRLQIVVKIGG